METKEMYQQIFQAFSALSDAQELIATNRLHGANEQVNHAKLHLAEIIKGDELGFARATMDLPTTCTLSQEGGEQ
jgi:hypothetical protein